MKKLLLGSIVLLIFSASIVIFQMSCKKSAVAQTPCPTPTYQIEGLWIGTYAVDGQPGLGQQYLSLTIKPDGTMINDSKAGGVQHLAIGTWTLVGDTALVTTATCVYGIPQNIGITQTHRATFNITTGLLTVGTWNNNTPPSGSGTFTLTKVN